MQQEMEHIRQGVEQSKSMGEMMPMPNFDGNGVSVKDMLMRPLGSILYHRKYTINFDNGDWIVIEYCSKGSDKKATARPHRSEVKVTCSDPSLNFTDSWDEKA